MGFVIPWYNIDPRLIDQINQEIKNIIAEQWPADKQANITWRPLRPEEINNALSLATRAYDTTGTGARIRILGAANDAVVRTGSVYAIFGWHVIDDPTTPMGKAAIGQIEVEGVVRNEVNLELASLMENHLLPTMDQIVVMVEQTNFSIYANAANLSNFLAFPQGYRIGPKAQLDQG